MNPTKLFFVLAVAVSVILSVSQRCGCHPATSHRKSCEFDCCIDETNFTCGRNGKGKLQMFLNPCEMKVHNCKNDEDFVRVFRGRCHYKRRSL